MVKSMDDGSIWRCLLSSVTDQPSVETATASGINAGSIIIYFILVILLILGGAYFAGAEISLASCNRVRMKAYAEDGNKKAQYVMYILNNFDQALSTILIGNNIMHIACASIVTLITRQLCRNNPEFLSAALVISTILITIVVFLVAEMIPKYYAKAFNERFALKISKSLYVLMKVLTPIAAVFTWIGVMFGKLFRKKKNEPAVTEDDLVDMIESFKDDREEDQETEASTSELMVHALQFGATTAGAAQTPWDKVEKLDTSMKMSEICEKVRASSHSRFPMLNAKGAITGVLNIRSFLKSYMKNGEDTELIDIIDTPLFIRPETPVDELLGQMSRNKIHLAFVSKQGEITGIITIEDILEELVGEIFDETDNEEAEVKAKAAAKNIRKHAEVKS